MTKSQDRYIRARLAPKDKVIERRTATIATRPLKLAFIIHEHTSRDQLLRFIEYNTSVWGGYYNLLLPTDGQRLREDWWQSLINHDPDLVIVGEQVAIELIDEVHKRVHPYYIWRWSDDILNSSHSDSDAFGSIFLRSLLPYLYQTRRPITDSNIRIPRFAPDYIYAEHASAQFGRFSQCYNDYCINGFKGQYVDFNGDDISTYLQYLSELEDKLTPIDLSRHYLSMDEGLLFTAPTVILLGETPTHDFCLFWNLRTIYTFTRQKPVLLPFSAFSKNHNIIALAHWFNKSVYGSNVSLLHLRLWIDNGYYALNDD
jgi:hypothetical protein